MIQSRPEYNFFLSPNNVTSYKVNFKPEIRQNFFEENEDSKNLWLVKQF